MAISVPVARRFLFQDRWRAAFAVAGTASGLLIVLLIGATYAGFAERETAYVEQLPADVVVSQAGVRTMQMSLSALPDDTVARVAAAPGVAWAESLRQTSSTVESGGQRLVTYVFGFDPVANRGGPQDLAAGTLPGPGEAVLDRGAARQLGIGVGDPVSVFGEHFVLSGLTDGFTSVANTAVFLTADDYGRLAGAGTNYVLVGAEPGVTADDLATQLRRTVPGTTVQTRTGFAAEQRRFLADTYLELFGTLQLIGFAVALALVALSMVSATSSRVREYSVIRALGARTTDLARLVGTQAVLTVTGAFVLAVLGAAVVSRVVDAWAPNLELVLRPGTAVATLAGALAIAVPGALLPLRRIRRLDPATAFRRPG